MRVTHLARLAAILVLCVVASRAGAATHSSLQISPRSLTLDATHSIGQLTMNSLSAQKVIFDVQTVAWQQDGDKDEFQPTKALAVVPPVFEIAPFRAMLVRAGLQQNPGDVKTEAAYQIRFREVLAPGASAEARTLVAPVFVAPAQRSGDIHYTLVRSGSEQCTLRIENAANAHVYLALVTIHSGEQVAYSGTLDEYILAGNTRSFLLKLEHPIEGSSAKITMKNGDQEESVDAEVR